METSEILTILSIFLASIGLFLTFYQIRKANIQNRIEYAVSLYNDFVNDKEMIEIYYKLEYSDFKYDENFHGSDNEKGLDKLLGYFSNIGTLYFRKILKEKDLDFLKYQLLIIYQNENIKNYLLFLDKWFQARNINDVKFNDFRRIGKFLEERSLSLKE